MYSTPTDSLSLPQEDTRYAGFWPRFGAGLVDLLILAPVIAAFVWLETVSKTGAVIAHLVLTPLFWAYTLYFHARFGQTPGKMLLKVIILRTDGRRIGWRESWLRSCVDLLFALISLVGTLLALQQISAAEYATLDWTSQSTRIASLAPSWARAAETAAVVWMFSEFVVLLFNRRRRAIHDYIAGTVVVRQRASSARA
jgi:uncharacterized RDD family membrane protein YckC